MARQSGSARKRSHKATGTSASASTAKVLQLEIGILTTRVINHHYGRLCQNACGRDNSAILYTCFLACRTSLWIQGLYWMVSRLSCLMLKKGCGNHRSRVSKVLSINRSVRAVLSGCHFLGIGRCQTSKEVVRLTNCCVDWCSNVRNQTRVPWMSSLLTMSSVAVLCMCGPMVR